MSTATTGGARGRGGDDDSSGRGLLTLALAMANFMQVLDLTIAYVALPAITSDLGAAPSQGAWIITSYAVANAISVPLTGWLSDRFGQVRLFVFATLQFTTASALCGLSWNLETLVFCRVLQGCAAGLMVPLSQALLMRSYPPNRQGMALTIWSMTTTIAPITGPLLGGWITENLNWSWIFLINIPVGILCAFGVWQLLKDRETAIRKLPLDRVGMALLVLWVGSLQLMLDKGNELDWFDSGFILSLAVIAALGFALFLAWETTEAHPVVDLSLFRERNFTLGVLTLSTMFGCFMSMNLLMTLWLQTQIGYTPQWAGSVTACGGIVTLLLAPMVGRVMHRVDPRVFASLGLILFSTFAYLRTHYTSGVDYPSLVYPQLVLGMTGAFVFAPLIGIIMGGIPPHRLAAAASTQNFMRTMFGSFGASLTVALWSNRGAQHHSNLADHVSILSPRTMEFIDGMGGLGVPQDQALGYLDRIIGVESFTLASNDLHLLASLLLLGAAILIWNTRPPFRTGGVAVAAD